MRTSLRRPQMRSESRPRDTSSVRPRRLSSLITGTRMRQICTCCRASRDDHPALPILMLTDTHSEELAVWAMRTRVWNYLVKPVPLRELKSNLETTGQAAASSESWRPRSPAPGDHTPDAIPGCRLARQTDGASDGLCEDIRRDSFSGIGVGLAGTQLRHEPIHLQPHVQGKLRHQLPGLRDENAARKSLQDVGATGLVGDVGRARGRIHGRVVLCSGFQTAYSQEPQAICTSCAFSANDQSVRGAGAS